MPAKIQIEETGQLHRLSRGLLLMFTLPMLGCVCLADGFLKIDDIEGEATTQGYIGWIEIVSFAAGLESTVSDSAEATRTFSITQPDSMEVEKRLDASSPYLFLAAAKQTSLKSVVLESRHFQRNQAQTLVRYELSNARIVALDTLTESTKNISDSPILESLSFSFEEWAMHYQRPGLEQIAASWNFKDGTGGLVGDDTPDVPQIDPFETLVSNPGGEYSIKVNLSDGDTPVEKLTIRAESLDPDKVTILGIEGSGSERSLKLLVSDLFSGSASVNLWVSDGFQSRSRTLSLSIEGGDTPYETFLLGAFGDALANNSSLASPIGDPDNDGLRTIAEFYLGTDPNQFTPSEDAIAIDQTVANGVVETQLYYYRRTDTPGLSGQFLLSPDLETWTPLNSQSDPAIIETSEPTEGPFEKVTATLTLPTEEWEKAFLRLQVNGTF